MIKPEIIIYKVYWRHDPNPQVIRGKSFVTALRLAGYNPDKAVAGIDYYTSSDSVVDEEDSNEF